MQALASELSVSYTAFTAIFIRSHCGSLSYRSPNFCCSPSGFVVGMQFPTSPWIRCGQVIYSGQWNVSRNYMSLPCGSFKSQCVISCAPFPSATVLGRVADFLWVPVWAPQPNLSGLLVGEKKKTFLVTRHWDFRDICNHSFHRINSHLFRYSSVFYVS